jgi:hypothetical protein
MPRWRFAELCEFWEQGKPLFFQGLIQYNFNMRRLSYILITSLILGVPSAHATKITPGSSCNSAGQKAIYKGKSYTCIKLGKKLYWDNGVPIKKFNTSLIDTPGTCNVVVPTWRMEVSDLWLDHRDVWFSAMLVNSSIKNMATDINVYIEYYDSYGIFKKDKILVPKLFPGQTLEFGGDADFNEGKTPTDVKLRATCKSKIWKQYKVITGKSPVILEQFSEEYSGQYGGKRRDITQIDATLKSRLIIDNVYDRSLTCDDGKCNFILYGTFKDTFGNTFGGIGIEYLSESFENEIEPGETGYINLQVGTLLTDIPIYPWLSRVNRFEYTIVPKF